VGGSSTRSTTAQALSAAATSACGRRAAIESPPTSSASGSISPVEGRREDAALVQVRDVERGTLPEAHQHPTLARDELDAESRAASVVPHRTGQRLEHPRGLDAAEARQVLEKLRLLVGELRRRREVLQGTAAAGAVVRARRRHAVGARHEYGLEHGLVEVAVASHAPEHDPLARQRTVDEHGLAVDARHAVGLVGEVDDVGLLGGRADALHPPPAVQAARNSARWARPAPPSQPRTSAHSRSCSSGVSRPRISSKRRYTR